MKQDNRTLQEVIRDNVTNGLGYDAGQNMRVYSSGDEYTDLHATLLTMDSATGKKTSLSEALDDVRAVARGISYEQLKQEKEERDQQSGAQFRPLPIPVRRTLRLMNKYHPPK